MDSDNILRTFAAVSDGAVDADHRDVVGPRPFAWTTYSSLDFFREEEQRGTVQIVDKRWEVAYDQIRAMGRAHQNEGLLRMGWIWFSGTIEQHGHLVDYCFPAISASITRPMTAFGASTSWQRLGEPQVSPLIEDFELRRSLLSGNHFLDDRLIDRLDPHRDGGVEEIPVEKLGEMTGLMTWCRDVSVAAGIRVEKTYSLHGKAPVERRFDPGIALHVGFGLYVAEPMARDSPSLSLSKLANSPAIRDSAFSLLYGDREPADSPPREVISFRPLSTRQREVASQLAGQDLAVISGAPGTGKSHVLSVLAGDAIANGESVLVAAGSAHAVDVLVDHFQQIPGPPPITFGGVRHGHRLLEELAELAEVVEIGRRSNSAASDEAATAQDERVLRLRYQLTNEALRSDLRSDTARSEAKNRLRAAGSLKRLRKLSRRVTGAKFETVVTSAARRELVEKLGFDHDFEDRITELEILEEFFSGSRPDVGGLADELDELERNETEAAKEGGAALTKRWIRQVGTTEELLLTRLRRILADEVSTRRGQLAGFQGKGLTRATPLWIGSVEEIDQVLPAIPQMFDLVILDEATQIGQLEAASTLARASRAIICGDPKQITYRSYLSKEDFEKAAFGHRTNADWLSPQSRSTYDLAAAQVPLAVLDEHFRSVPQLIGFSAKHFYEDRLHVTTRTPANEDAKRISVSFVEGTRNGSSSNANQAEVSECLRIVEALGEKGWTSIGLISPFRAQADALTAVAQSHFNARQIEELGLRIGTVHQFQGDERDVVVLSLAVGTDEEKSPWRFVNQPDLFNVMVTRARENLILVTSNESPPGFAGDYVRWAKDFSAAQADLALDDPWIQKMVEALTHFDIPVRTGYRVGRYVIDIVAGSGTHAVALDCIALVGQVSAHIDRAMLLRRAGWRTSDAYESKWGEEPERYVRSLLEQFPEIKADSSLMREAP